MDHFSWTQPRHLSTNISMSARLIALLLVSCPVASFAQVSPGPLTEAHAHLEGLLSCTECHTLGARTPELKCLSCHMEIRERLDNKTGYHAKVVDRQRGGIECARCHAEHAGRNFNLIRWPGDLKQFDHAQTGLPLEGKHAVLECAQCHKPDRIPAARRAAIKVKDLNRTYLGLDRSCLSCHTDPHRSELGNQCTTCHSQNAWRPVISFNHDGTRFPLTGGHTKVACRDLSQNQRGSDRSHVIQARRFCKLFQLP